jgi:GT2 family glycosyltransferase
MKSKKRIHAIVVLYKMTFDQSRGLTSLLKAISEDDVAAETIDVTVCDNTPYEQPAAVDFAGSFYRDTTNPGLAHWYDLVLQDAAKCGLHWIMLLDQDTEITAPYIAEVIARTNELEEKREIVAIIPKLVQQHDIVCSPLPPPTYRHPKPFDGSFVGVPAGRLHVFNSGAVLRVSALKEAGGFPKEFPLDYLDHATFAALQSRGGKLFVLRSTLKHELSSSNLAGADAASAERHRSMLLAERQFYKLNGSVRDRFYRRIRLLRGALGVLIKHGEVSWSFRMMKAALR